jgi:hypothetical protein
VDDAEIIVKDGDAHTEEAIDVGICRHLGEQILACSIVPNKEVHCEASIEPGKISG